MTPPKPIGPIPAVFRSFLAVAGARLTPTTLSKAILAELTQTLEDLILVGGARGTVLTGVQAQRSWLPPPPASADGDTSEDERRSVMTTGELGPTTTVHRFLLETGETPVQEWFLIALTDRFSAALFGREFADQNPEEERDRQFASVWTFDPVSVALVTNALATTCEPVSASSATQVRAALAEQPARSAAPGIEQRFGNAVFERLEASRSRWRSTTLQLRDTQRRLAEQHRARLRLERVAAAGSITAYLANDLDALLTSLASSAAALGADPAGEDRDQHLEVIERQTGRARELVDELLRFSARRSASRTGIPFDELLNAALADLPTPDGRPPDVEVGPLPEVVIEVDPGQLRQVLTNLIDNALHAPGRQLPVQVAAAVQDNLLWVRVGDDGTGIHPEVLPRVFEPLVTSKPAGEGTGLGLPIAASYVEDHDGHLEVTATGPEGTILTLSLPIAGVPPAGQQTPATDADHEASTTADHDASTADHDASTDDHDASTDEPEPGTPPDTGPDRPGPIDFRRPGTHEEPETPEGRGSRRDPATPEGPAAPGAGEADRNGAPDPAADQDTAGAQDPAADQDTACAQNTAEAPTAPGADTASTPADAAIAPVQAAGDPRRCLVIDDEAAIRGLVEALLTRAGWEVVTTPDADVAVVEARSEHFDVVLLDVDLEHGREQGELLLERLARVQPGVEQRTAFITGSGADEEQLGRTVLAKPFTWTRLRTLLERMTVSQQPDA